LKEGVQMVQQNGKPVKHEGLNFNSQGFNPGPEKKTKVSPTPERVQQLRSF
jgi:hypothetical protein